MPFTVTIDGAGRIVVPLEVRRRLGLAPGTRLLLTDGSDHVLLEPQRSEPTLREEAGVYVVGDPVEGDIPDHRAVRGDRLDRFGK